VNNFYIELKETSQGLEKLSAQIDGKHWIGFLNQKEGKYSDGKPYFYKTAQMKICTWAKCQICLPANFKILKY
jgi:hypothetical protein